MKRHAFDPIAFFFGVAFVAVGLSTFAGFDDWPAKPGWFAVGGVLLLGVGTVMSALVAAFRKADAAD